MRAPGPTVFTKDIPSEEAIKDFVASHCPDYLFVILAGSAGNSSINVCSDIDLVVVTASFRYPAAKVIDRIDEWPIDLLILREDRCSEALVSSRRSAFAYIPNLLAYGTYVAGDQKKSLTLITHARAILEEGPYPPSAREILNYRLRLTNMLNNIKCKTSDEWKYIAIPFLGLLMETYCRILGSGWREGGRHAYREIRENAPELANLVTHVISNISEHSLTIIDLGIDILNKIGGPVVFETIPFVE